MKMASRRGTKDSRLKSPKKEDDDDDFLEDLVVDSNPKRPKKPATYSNLKPGGFVMKAEDQKGRLEKRWVKIEMAKDDDDDEETEKECTVSFKSICRSGTNPEKVLRIRGGAMQVYHHNQ